MDNNNFKSVINNGYEVKTDDPELLAELSSTDRKNPINWFNFESGDSFWDENDNEFSIVAISYDLKIVVIQRC
jgi:hypothetical protein